MFRVCDCVCVCFVGYCLCVVGCCFVCFIQVFSVISNVLFSGVFFHVCFFWVWCICVSWGVGVFLGVFCVCIPLVFCCSSEEGKGRLYLWGEGEGNSKEKNFGRKEGKFFERKRGGWGVGGGGGTGGGILHEDKIDHFLRSLREICDAM